MGKLWRKIFYYNFLLHERWLNSSSVLWFPQLEGTCIKTAACANFSIIEKFPPRHHGNLLIYISRNIRRHLLLPGPSSVVKRECWLCHQHLQQLTLALFSFYWRSKLVSFPYVFLLILFVLFIHPAHPHPPFLSTIGFYATPWSLPLIPGSSHCSFIHLPYYTLPYSLRLRLSYPHARTAKAQTMRYVPSAAL